MSANIPHRLALVWDVPRMGQPSNDRLPSTTWVWKRVKIRRPPEANSDSQPKAVRWRRFPRRNMREFITVRIKLRGGAECWVEVQGRGSVGRYMGGTPIYDILRDINNDYGPSD